ncbi:MAG: DNA polymerase III subunit alpha, partial [Spirochaetota bacterium]
GFNNPEEYLKHLTQKGLEQRYGEVTKEIQERADYELGVITGMHFTGYFLIVWDFIHWAKLRDIPVGPGRGSGAGSIVAYALTITDIDPLKYKLLFERFLNPERVSMPDFDIDFCFERRQEVIDYVTNKYGTDRVAQIITFGTLKAKAVVKDVARVLDIPFAETNEISKLIPADPKMTIDKAMEQEPQLKELESKGGVYTELFDVGRRLEGLNRHCSTHAAGIVIGHDELTEYVPLYRDPKTEAVSTQYTMDVLEDCGLVKMDFLGLKTLTLIKNTVDLINKQGGDFDINFIPEDDEKTFGMLWEGASSCVFQFESQGMQGILKDAKPNSIEDLIALNALYRPGPMANIPKFIASKNGQESIEYYHKDLEKVLEPTYGVIVYQEQVMEVAQIIGGFSLGKADIMRRAMGKKKTQVMAEMKQEFTEGAKQRGYTAELAKNIFEMLEPFAGYGFNKSHAAAYSVIAYQTAYLKANYPVEFMAANLTNEINNTDKLTQYINETKSMGIEILPPNINLSDLRFNAVDGKIVYGLNGIKNVGAGAVNSIIQERDAHGEFASFMEFLNRVETKVLNRKLLESLIQAGAFDCLGENRATLLLNLEDVMDFVSKRRSAEQFGQVSLFDLEEEESLGNFQMKPAEELSLTEKLQLERQLLGFYFSGHPMDEYRDIWKNCVTVDLSRPEQLQEKHACNLLGMINSLRTIVTKRGEQMAFGQIEDFQGSIELIFFPKVWQQYRHMLELDKILGFTGKIDKQRGEPKFLVDEVVEPGQLKEDGISQIHVKLQRQLCTTEHLSKFRDVCLEYPGSCSLYLHLANEGGEGETVIKASGQVRLTYSDTLVEMFKEHPVVTDVWYL